MKQIISILLCVVLVLSLTACGGTETLQTAEVIDVNTAQDSPTYVEGEDCQQQWNSWSTIVGKMTTEGEGGYYFYDEDGTQLLYFHDYATGQTVPLCNRPDCDHSGDCSARLQFATSYLHWYDGNLYSLYTSGNGDVILQRISPDGASKDVVGTVLSMSNGGSVMAAFHRGYVYCVPTGQGLVKNSTKVYRMSLGGGEEAELIHTFEPVIGGNAFLRAYGNYLYILHQHYADKDANGYNADLWRYNIHTGETELVMEGMRRMFAVDAEYLYYDNETQVIARNLESGEEQVVLESGITVVITYDGTYLYCDNQMGHDLELAPAGMERTITIIDTETLEPVGSVNWLRDFSYNFIGAVDGALLGALCYTTEGRFYTCDLEAILTGTGVVWEETGLSD